MSQPLFADSSIGSTVLANIDFPEPDSPVNCYVLFNRCRSYFVTLA